MEEPRNVDVRCDIPSCQTHFVTSFDSFVEDKKSVTCPKCGEYWGVHMIYEDGRLIHPTDKCPTCGGPNLLMEYYRCTRRDTQCVNGHHSHMCGVHRVRVPGEDDHDLSKEKGCTCPPEKN